MLNTEATIGNLQNLRQSLMIAIHLNASAGNHLKNEGQMEHSLKICAEISELQVQFETLGRTVEGLINRSDFDVPVEINAFFEYLKTDDVLKLNFFPDASS